MTGRQTLLAEIEAKRRENAAEPVEVLQADLVYSAEETGYDPYDNPGPAKPLSVEREASTSRTGARKPR
jgi:hypothetical protein